MEMTLYISKYCPESQEVLKQFQKLGYKFRMVDIHSSMDSLREFLVLRDEEDFFKDAKRNNRIGVPTIMFGDREIFIDVEDGFDSQLIEEYLA